MFLRMNEYLLGLSGHFTSISLYVEKDEDREGDVPGYPLQLEVQGFHRIFSTYRHVDLL